MSSKLSLEQRPPVLRGKLIIKNANKKMISHKISKVEIKQRAIITEKVEAKCIPFRLILLSILELVFPI